MTRTTSATWKTSAIRPSAGVKSAVPMAIVFEPRSQRRTRQAERASARKLSIDGAPFCLSIEMRARAPAADVRGTGRAIALSSGLRIVILCLAALLVESCSRYGSTGRAAYNAPKFEVPTPHYTLPQSIECRNIADRVCLARYGHEWLRSEQSLPVPMPASISSVSTADGYGLIVYLAGPSNGLIVFRKMHHSWRVISSGGLSLNYRALLGVGVPESIARQLVAASTKPNGGRR